MLLHWETSDVCGSIVCDAMTVPELAISTMPGFIEINIRDNKQKYHIIVGAGMWLRMLYLRTLIDPVACGVVSMSCWLS